MTAGAVALVALAARGIAGNPLDDPSFFPLAVWVQEPANAPRYRAAGINCYVGLWKGPTEEQLAKLKAAGMPVVCEQNEVGLAHLKDPTIIGWMHGDEPDNAQSLGEGKGWGTPVPAREIVADFRKIKAADPARPVLLNLGQGVAWDGWYGRNVPVARAGEFTYPEYAQGSDIVSFDIYPAVHDRPEIAGKLEYVALGVERLKAWAGGRRVWNCIEASRIGNVKVKPTPAQIRSEAWMAIARGSTGLIYFVHQFEPKFVEASLLEDPELLAAVTELNREIQAMAPALNGRDLTADLSVVPAPETVPVAAILRRQGGAWWIVAASLRASTSHVTFRLNGVAGRLAVEVLGEGRSLRARGGAFGDGFGPYGVHRYRIIMAE